MHDARDAEDRRLLGAVRSQLLVESYYGVILDRCRARLRTEGDAVDVAADVVIRLLTELKRGKTYAVPFRVVVHQVTTWKVKEFFTQVEAPWSSWNDLLPSSHDGGSAIESDLGPRAAVRRLATTRSRRSRRSCWRSGMEITEIAARLGLKRNAVDQSLHRTAVWLRGRAA